MKKLVAILLFVFSSSSYSVWSAFAHVTPATESEYGIRVEFAEINQNLNREYRIKIPAIGHGYQKAWLVLTAQPLEKSGAELRAYIWWKEQPKARVLSALEMIPKVTKEGIFYETLLSEDEVQNGYIYVDYPHEMFDGGYYYSIELRSYVSGREASANKAFKPLAMLARTFGTPPALAHGFAIFAQRPLRTKRRLTGR
ncbi:hypothetical protein [Thiosocius teredinicola]|uniref:hypothetical protein n=1 Tax=Thiosocius teredinicola TaxID=1973002 RepID=UPI00099134E5